MKLAFRKLNCDEHEIDEYYVARFGDWQIVVCRHGYDLYELNIDRTWCSGRVTVTQIPTLEIAMDEAEYQVRRLRKRNLLVV